MNIGSKIRKRRIEKGYSQEYLADKLSISQATLSNIESDKSIPDILVLQKITKELDLEVQDLLNSEKIIINNVENNHGVGYAEIVNQLSEKVIEQYELRLRDLYEINENLKSRLSKYE
jgi:transcriptional regulator with XRE-family HTH domain